MNDYYNRFRIVFKKTGMNVKRRSGTFDEKVRTFSCQMEDYKYLFFNFLHSLKYKTKFGNNYVNWKEFPFKIPAKATRMRFDGTFLGFSLKNPFFSFSNFTPFFQAIFTPGCRIIR